MGLSPHLVVLWLQLYLPLHLMANAENIRFPGMAHALF
jgi:hypothetical protein